VKWNERGGKRYKIIQKKGGVYAAVTRAARSHRQQGKMLWVPSRRLPGQLLEDLLAMILIQALDM